MKNNKYKKIAHQVIDLEIQALKKLRRSIFAKTDIEKNMKITKEQITTLRPLIGVPASNFFKIIGKKTRKKILAGTPIYQKDFF